MRLKKTLMASVIAITCLPANASVQSDLNNFFDSMGFSTNVTPGGVYKGQTGGYYTGGNVFARTPTRNYQLMSIQMPSFRAGCGGIDMFAGSFSFINSDQLVAMFKNIGSNALGLAFKVALSTISPKLDGLVNDMNTLANKINGMNVNSCEAAANLLGGVLPKTDATQKALCSSMGNSLGSFSDYAQAKQECGSGGQRASVLQAAQADPQFKDVTPTGNYIWKALKKINSTSSDTALAEMVMSMTGTIIFPLPGNDNAPNAPSDKPPTIIFNDNKDISAFLFGGDVTVYSCGGNTAEFECLTPTEQTIQIDPADGYAAKIDNILTSMVDKMYTETALSASELNLLNETSLPVYKMLNVATAYSRQYADTWKSTYANAIAIDILYQYFNSLTRLLSSATSTLQIPDDLAESFRTRISDARKTLDTLRETKRDEVDASIAMMKESMAIEKMLISGMTPGLANSVQWSKSVQ